MFEVYPTLTALFTDIADAIRETTGDTDLIIADDFPDVIRKSLQAVPPISQFNGCTSLLIDTGQASGT